METTAQQDRRQRLAWMVLIASFFLCLMIGVAIPVAASAIIQNAKQDLLVNVQANQGTVGIDDSAGVRRAALAGDTPEAVEPAGRILTDATANAIMIVASPEDESTLARLTIDSNSTLTLLSATAPLFSPSSASHALRFALESGRLRLSLPESERPATTQFTTPQGQITIRLPGEYTITVDNEATEVSVDRGAANILADENTLILAAGERAEIPTGSAPQGPLSPRNNLVSNGDFTAGLDDWSKYAWIVERADQPLGRTDFVAEDGEPLVRFERDGIGHAEARIQQSIGRNVADYESLRILLTLRIDEQSLGVCGVQGSECPLFLRVSYVDQNGAEQVWQHGFYAEGTVDDNETPGACISCAVIQSNHLRVPLGQDFFYDVDLPEELARQGASPPREINNIALIASGHSFSTEVINVSIVVE